MYIKMDNYRRSLSLLYEYSSRLRTLYGRHINNQPYDDADDRDVSFLIYEMDQIMPIIRGQLLNMRISRSGTQIPMSQNLLPSTIVKLPTITPLQTTLQYPIVSTIQVIPRPTIQVIPRPTIQVIPRPTIQVSPQNRLDIYPLSNPPVQFNALNNVYWDIGIYGL
jgi:hypothetical protein